MKKLLCLILALAMVLGTMGVPVFANDSTVDTFDELKTAIMNASAGDTIVLGANIEKTAYDRDGDFEPDVAIIIDLNGKTLSLNGDNLFSSDITFKNGTIEVGPKTSTAFIWMWDDADLVLEGVELIADGATGYSIISGSKTGSVSIINSTITITDSGDSITDTTEATVVADCKSLILTDSDVSATNVARGFVNVEISADSDSSVVMENNTKTALRNVSGAIDCEVTITGCDYGVENGSDRTLVFEDNANVSISNSVTQDVCVEDNAEVIVTPNANVEVSDASEVTSAVAELNGKYYTSLEDAIDAAVAVDGVVTYNIYGKAVLNRSGWISPRGKSGATTINFVGMTEDAEICLASTNPAIIATDAVTDMVAINYTDLTLSKLNGHWAGDYGHSNNYFTTWMRGAEDAVVTYTNCVFPNGSSNNQYNETVYTNCEFYNSTENALWIYGGEVTVEGGYFEAAKGVQAYSEGNAEITTKISGATFDIANTPAFISASKGTFAVENVNTEACEYGLFETQGKDGKAENGIAAITIDGESPKYVTGVTYRNPWGYPVTSYVTNSDYAEFVTESYPDFPQNSIDALGVMIANENGTVFYDSLEDAIAAAEVGDTITVLSDVAYANADFTTKKNGIVTPIYIAKEKDVVLDLNGYEISAERTSNVNSALIVNDGTLEITDSSEEKSGKISYNFTGEPTGNYGKVHTAVWNLKSLVVSGGTVENITANEGEVFSAVESASNKHSWDVDLTITGGTIAADSYYAVRHTASHINPKKASTTPYWRNDVTVTGGTLDGGFYSMVGIMIDTDIAFSDDAVLIGDFVSAMKIRKMNSGDEWWGEITPSITGGLYEGAVEYLDLEGEPIETKFISGGTFTENVSEYVADGFDLYRTATGYVAVDEDEEFTAESISVEYEDITEDGVEGEKTYAIVVKANDEEEINELASVDLTFAYTTVPVTGGAIDFTVAPAADFSMTRYGTSDRYMFNYNGVTAHEGFGNAITVGTITVTGYGSYTIATDNSEVAKATNIVNATTLDDNLVDSYTVDGAEDKDLTTGALITTASIGGNVVVPTRELTINIDFPNAVNDNAVAYQDMKVEITGTIDGVNQTVAYDLGKDGDWKMEDGDYVVTEDRLVLNNAYTVTVSGAGYRTARYTVTMTEDKELTFWNNVMDDDTAVEEGVFETKKTFLAGDIVKDNNINIYDLSAVVSYFATETIDAEGNILEADYAKYDLNRDGVIDSRDVAYVLVSWGE